MFYSRLLYKSWLFLRSEVSINDWKLVQQETGCVVWYAWSEWFGEFKYIFTKPAHIIKATLVSSTPDNSILSLISKRNESPNVFLYIVIAFRLWISQSMDNLNLWISQSGFQSRTASCHTCNRFQKGIREIFLSFQGGLSTRGPLVLYRSPECWRYVKISGYCWKEV